MKYDTLKDTIRALRAVDDELDRAGWRYAKTRYGGPDYDITPVYERLDIQNREAAAKVVVKAMADHRMIIEEAEARLEALNASQALMIDVATFKAGGTS